ncbi:MAG: VWA domain-containing protein, partial [Tissierella sp.]|nr:VWA domain-containing protein [Tissierella sp.]
MTNAKNAAINFINTMIPADDNLRIAIVSFSSSYQGAQLVTVNRNFTRNIGQLTSSVNGLTALGGTHTQAGIMQGSSVLNGSSADNKYMILLSDGQPTYSYQPANWTIETRLFDRNQYTAIYDGNYNTGTVVGDGSNLTQSWNTGGAWTGIRYHINNGSAAIKAGQDARVGIDGLFTIAVQAGSVGTPILNQIASPGMAYSTENPGELEEIYDRIGTQISTQYAIRNATIVDEMGDGFSIVNNTLSTSEGSTMVTGPSGTNNQTITWTIDPAITQLVPGSTNIRYAEMTYRVEINDDILSLSGAKTNEHQLFKTNKVTRLTYTDVNDQGATVDITSPEVNPVLLRIKKILTNPMDPENRHFNVEISKEEANSFSQTVELVPNVDYVWLTSLRHEGTYSVEETSITGDGLTNIDGFNISYKVDGQIKDSFEVYHDNGTPRGDVTIEVTNKQKGEATPDEPLIRISKTFSGLSQEQINQLSDFKTTITSQSDQTRTRDLFLSEGVRSIELNGDITYKWELEGWPAGTYTIMESGEELENYNLVIENDGTVTTVAATVNWNPALWKKPNTQVNNDLRVGGVPPNIVATKLSKGEGVFVWTETRLSASQRLAVIASLSGYSELGLTESNGYWYSGEDIAGDDFYFRGYKIQYNHSTGNLHIPQSNQWALIISGAYEFIGGDPADIGVKNSYALKTVDVTIEKEITGNFGDLSKEFLFTVLVNGDESNPRSFRLTHGGSETLQNIPANAVLTLMEESDGYQVTVKVGGKPIDPIDGEYTINLTGKAITIKVTNHKYVDIDTGISMDTIPYILILSLVTLGLGVGFVRKRNFRKED